MPARFTLHGIYLSGPTYKVGLFLSLAGEPFDYVHVSLRDGEHKQPAFLARQRFGQVPLLTDEQNGRNLCQSASILEYLADMTGKFGGANLDERIQAREWMYWDFDRFAAPVLRLRGIKRGFRTAPAEVADMYAADGRASLELLDRHLAGRSWIVGEGPTMADIDLYGVAAFAGEAGFDLAAFSDVAGWMGRVEALPGFAPPQSLLPTSSRQAA